MKVVNLIRDEGWLTIDIDVYKMKMSKGERVLHVEAALYNLLYTFGRLYVRVSSSWEGIHIVVDVDEQDVIHIREQYDDVKRLRIDEERQKHGVRNGRYLFFQKGRRRAGQWLLLEDTLDVERFVREFFVYAF